MEIMEEELNYVAVTFKTRDIFTPEKHSDREVIYEEVKTQELTCDTNPAIPGNKKEAPLHTPLNLVAAALVFICVILVSVIIALTIHFNTVISEQYRENTNLTAQNLQLSTEKTDLERRTQELTRERDGLNWTIGVILEYENFPVNTRCPQKVCKPCLDGWVLFQSNCYLFSASKSYWRTWEGSRDQCRRMKADLVVIGSQEEQEFINNHTEYYLNEEYGYWIGLSKKNTMSTWTWVDGSNSTVTYWITQQIGYEGPCALTLPRADKLANWNTANCLITNRWICETRALIKSD